MTQTMERSVTTASPPVTSRRPWWVLAVAVVVAVALGALGGWWLARATEAEPAVVVTSGSALTARQQAMLDVADQYFAAWKANDPDAVASFFAPGGELVRVGGLAGTYRVDDGSLAGLVRFADRSAMVRFEPTLVDENTLSVVTEFGGVRQTNVLEFTPTGVEFSPTGGDVLITLHVSVAS